MLKALSMMDAIKEYNCVKLTGGVLPTADPEYMISKKQINFIALGEGEITLVDVAESVKNKKNLTKIKSTWFKDVSGKIHKNPKNQLVDINHSVPDYSLFDPKRF